MPTPIAKLDTDKNFRALLVGPNGRGKTIAAASFPGKTLIIDFDKRHKPIIDWYPDRLDDFLVEIITPANFWTVFKPLMDELIGGKNPYRNIIIDSVTSMSTTTVVMQMKVKGQEGKITKGGVAVPSWDEFNGEAMLISQLLEDMKDLNSNLFVTAHPVTKTNISGSGSKKSVEIIAFGTKLGPIIPGYFDEIYYFDVEADISPNKPAKRYVYTRPSAEWPDAKTALKKIPGKIDITDKNMYDVIKEYL